ncbi:hypothetical protein, partial [Eubacterium callanderi]|uniref:hypothetical protein n=1 Tax=Eubacterium callanderi TaxID=53442 RepID=UPI00210887E8
MQTFKKALRGAFAYNGSFKCLVIPIFSMLGEAVKSYGQHSGARLHRFIQKPSFLIITHIRTKDVMARGGSWPPLLPPRIIL